ncbi:MAG: bifunctional phosphopantothenoylcysteine decarboxylase/phosphopantothenate--cysteine ligase CoaBC [Rhodospirillaceae bacterium]|nr:bifunctional phosphopantothenoylcysteine decarboxylase/phosphopantothenate--cysteine ligase CoaBC [Rhodospirillaceae bacterium]MBT4219243.1 bifunctional phosphopantothenoylcysteine decarboxylase/phosphopantothenate--cysteine ligase CoaBC [Rhodospirillaceae bacterium]MBT6407039.1 bifunctional phosphopantothenoylcysteine decarboxylase/phosphopantothenate--cysteine ligase CoaBC [Rhodospirillaceae bacterium]MBT7356461.1 bifunctional phosphopantothenoylcysteine decarboxylase/phosphopantothenate--c
MGNRVLLIVSGGIAAVKCPDLIRRLADRGIATRCVLTRGGAEFVTPLSLAALSGDKVYEDLFSLTDENDMGHIELSRDADLILVAPASADILAKMAGGLATDLATTALLATDKPVMVAPAMNVRMWDHAATRANIDTLKARGINVIGPEEGEMACGEFGFGRMSEPADIVRTVETFLNGSGRLSGRSALVTSGPTFEAIDPVRYVANRSSGKQGHAIASALSRLGADTVLVSGPTHLPDPPGVHVVHVESAADMMAACETALPRDIAVCAAAVSDWRAASPATIKLKKNGQDPEPLALTLNADILASLGNAGNRRPGLLIGFAAETDNVIAHAEAKLAAKGCDWIVANDVSAGTGTFGGDDNTVHLITPDGVDDWPAMSKVAVADKLAGRIADTLEDRP